MEKYHPFIRNVGRGYVGEEKDELGYYCTYVRANIDDALHCLNEIQSYIEERKDNFEGADLMISALKRTYNRCTKQDSGKKP